MRQPKYGTLSTVPAAALYGDIRTYGSVRGRCRRPGCTCGRNQDLDDAAVYYHVLGASSLGAASLGRASLGRGHAPRRRSAVSVHSDVEDVYLPVNDPLLRKLSRKDRFSSVSSRRSILECDVTAYDLIKKYLRTPAAPDSDDDDLNSNAILRAAGSGQKQRPKLPPTMGPRDRPPATLGLWPEEPDPDYDEDSDVGLEAGRFKDLKISYSPPLVRKGSTVATKVRASETRRAHSCSPARPSTAAKTATVSPSAHLKSILKKSVQDRKPVGTQRGRTSKRRVTFQEGSEPVVSAWEDPWMQVPREVTRSRPSMEVTWEHPSKPVARPTRLAKSSTYRNGHASVSSSKHKPSVERSPTRRLEPRPFPKGEAYVEFRPDNVPDEYADQQRRPDDRCDLKNEQKIEVRPTPPAEQTLETIPDVKSDPENEGRSEDWNSRNGRTAKAAVDYGIDLNGDVEERELSTKGQDLKLEITTGSRIAVKVEANSVENVVRNALEQDVKIEQVQHILPHAQNYDVSNGSTHVQTTTREEEARADSGVDFTVDQQEQNLSDRNADDAISESSSPDPPAHDREAKLEPVVETRTRPKVGFKVNTWRSEVNPESKAPAEQRISRPLSPPPPIPTAAPVASRRQATEEERTGEEDKVMVTTQTSTGTRVLISSHGRLSGSYPVRRSPVKRRARMRHSAPQLDGDSARALFAPAGGLQLPKETTSTFYVSLTSGGIQSDAEEQNVGVQGQRRATARPPEEPLYADTLPTSVSPPDCVVYDDCGQPQEPLYEELPDQPTLQHREKKLLPFDVPQKSFFEGASKADILGYLEDAKVRGLENLVSDLGTVTFEALAEDTTIDKLPSSADVERNDSGIGGDRYVGPLEHHTSGTSEEQRCADCDQQVSKDEELVCPKCEKKRTERREIITEIVQTELKYGHDLRIVKEEFYKPIETAGLLTKPQLHEIFINLDELISVNATFSEKLQDALDIASEQGDEEYTTVDIGKLFLNSSGMLQAFQTYCVRQASASMSLMAQEKEKELLRIFLRVSQMENTLLRRMNLAAFLMAPVQRVTK